MMKSDNSTPIYASILILNSKYIIAEIKTEIDNIASLKASDPLATSESEFTSLPFFLTYIPKINFTIIPATKIIKVTIL